MRQTKPTVIGITMGDPGGIGPEVTLKALYDKALKAYAVGYPSPIRFILIGNADIYYHQYLRMKKKQLRIPVFSSFHAACASKAPIVIYDIGDSARGVTRGALSKVNARHAFHALEIGTDLALAGDLAALVNAPLNKEAVQLLVKDFTGHTEYLAARAHVKDFAMMLCGGPLRVVLVTTHMPLARVSAAISAKEIERKIALTYTFLREKAHIKQPRIGVAGLNPHAGEGGKIGTEEITHIMPAVKRMRKKGIGVEGPLPADVIFHEAYQGKLDAIIAMYHDQGLGPLKMIAFESGVNITVGLPFVRTSTDHGTAFNIVHKNCAHPGSMIAALITALGLVKET